MTILVTGGAGYIGSHVVKALKGEDLVVLDNLSSGFKEAVLHGEFIHGDVGDTELLEKLFSKYKFEAVLHFAGSIVVPESVENPLKYYQNNTINSHKLLMACVKHNTKHFIFSSTAAVYGIPENGICAEDSPLKPINPYGHSKLMTEQMLWDTCQAHPLKAIALRYFNVAGADPDGELGQSFPKATHLIKVASEAAVGKRKFMEVYGTDYPTTDGTCVRDYIHVSDLAQAHVCALRTLREGSFVGPINCGYGRGFSVKEVVERVHKLSGVQFEVKTSGRRAGDPASLTAKVEKIQKLMKWEPKFNDLDVIIRSALDWEKKKRF